MWLEMKKWKRWKTAANNVWYVEQRSWQNVRVPLRRTWGGRGWWWETSSRVLFPRARWYEVTPFFCFCTAICGNQWSTFILTNSHETLHRPSFFSVHSQCIVMRESLTFVTRVMLEAMMSLVPARLVTYQHKYVLYFAPNDHHEVHTCENGIRSLLWLPAFPQNINWVIVPAVNWNIYSSLWSLPWSLDLSVDNLYHLPTSSSRQHAV